jgi:hypothetical protein
MTLRQKIAVLKEYMSGAFQAHAFPGPEVGRALSTGAVVSAPVGDDGREQPERPRKAGREREEPRWRRPSR